MIFETRQHHAADVQDGPLTATERSPAGDDEQAPDLAHTAQISNEMVRLYKSLFGRGPTRARTSYAGPDTILVTLEHSLTPAEQTLAEMGEHQRLRDVRMFFQYAREEDFRDVIERATGRQVRAFISGIDTKQDVSVELFYLHPRPSD